MSTRINTSFGSKPQTLSPTAHRVLRNTYILLGLTVAFSALTAYIAMSTNARPLHWGIVLAGFFGLFMLVNATRNSVFGIVSIFALTGFMGWTLGPLLSYTLNFANGPQLIMMAMGGTAAIFFAMSGIVLATGKDFGFLGNFLMVGLIALIVLSLSNIFFFQLPLMSVAISAAVILLFSGFLLMDVSDIVQERETNYIMATAGIYINIYNIFANLLSLLGIFGGE